MLRIFFMYSLVICMPFYKSVCLDPLAIFNQVIWGVLLLTCIFWILTTYMWITNIFSHFIVRLFTLLIVSFTKQKIFRLMNSHLFMFAIVTLAFGVKSKIIKMSRSLPAIFGCYMQGNNGKMTGLFVRNNDNENFKTLIKSCQLRIFI